MLELGAGTGACGLAAAALGARRVLLTDKPVLLPLLSANVAANRFDRSGSGGGSGGGGSGSGSGSGGGGSGCVVECAELTWRSRGDERRSRGDERRSREDEREDEHGAEHAAEGELPALLPAGAELVLAS